MASFQRGVLLTDMHDSLVSSPDAQSSALAALLLEPQGMAVAVFILSTRTSLDFRDGAQVLAVIGAEQGRARSARASDVQLGRNAVQLGPAGSVDVNRIVGAHVVGNAVGGGEGGGKQQQVLIIVQHESAAPHHESLTFHAVFRDPDGGGGGGEGGASKADGSAGAVASDDWLTWAQALQLRVLGEAYQPEFDRRPSLVLLNPVSAAKDAVPRFEKYGRPYLQRTHVDMEVVITEHQTHAREIVMEADLLNKYRSVVVGSGDGMLYDVVQAIMARPDALEVIRRVRLAILPLGSGNGLAYSVQADPSNGLVSKSHEHEHALLDALFLVARNKAVPLDLAAVQTHDEIVHWSFLSLEWALFADIDIESEKCRCCGDARFMWWGLWRILCCLRRYHGAFSYLPLRGRSVAASSAAQRMEEGGAAAAEEEEEAAATTPTTGPASQLKLDLLPSLSEPVPDEWETIDDTITQFWACNTTKQAAECIMAPQAGLADGLWHITVNRNPTCCKMAALAGSFETGDHLHDPETEIFSTRAFRLVPRDPAPPGLLAVDGEVVEYGPIQVQVFKGMMRVVG